jgi:hypothetical protein
MRFEFFMIIKIKILVFLIMTLYSFFGGYQYFSGTFHFHLQERSVPEDGKHR